MGESESATTAGARSGGGASYTLGDDGLKRKMCCPLVTTKDETREAGDGKTRLAL
jgi:hypothetical protein